MPLATHVQNRIQTQLLVELTNPNDRSATTVNATVLGYAVDDVSADLQIYAGVAYVDTDARHVAAAVRGVLLYLRQYAGRATGIYDEIDRWHKMLTEDLRAVAGNNRLLPRTTSVLDPTDETVNARPAFDPEAAWTDLVPDPSGGGGRYELHGNE